MCVVLHVVHESIQLYAHTYNRYTRCVLFYTLYTRLYSFMLIHITDVDDVCCSTRCTRDKIVVCSYIKQTETTCVVVHEVIQMYPHTQNRCRQCVLLYTLFTRKYSYMLMDKTDVDDVCCCTRCTRGYIVVYTYIKQTQTMCIVVHVVHEVIQLYAHT